MAASAAVAGRQLIQDEVFDWRLADYAFFLDDAEFWRRIWSPTGVGLIPDR
jgi:hypothetical protein